MDRREFVRQVGLGLAAGWAWGRLSWPFKAWAAGPELRLALLADAHLKDGNDRRPEALALARAVAEIRGLSPAAGPGALRRRPGPPGPARRPGSGPGNPGGPALAPVGGAGGRGSRPGGKIRLGPALGGTLVLPVVCAASSSSGWTPPGAALPNGPVFEIGAAQRQWLARELARLASATPLVILSHAPLARLFHPWQQWTGDAPEVARLLARFSQVLCLHGHVHGAGIREPGRRITEKSPHPP